MKLIQLPFSTPINTSLQKGDIVYYSPLSAVSGSGFSQALTGNITKLGIVVDMDHLNETVTVMHPDTITPPGAGDYIMFEKDKRVNSSSLIGYYADVKFKNYSTDKIELFSIGSEVSENSK